MFLVFYYVVKVCENTLYFEFPTKSKTLRGEEKHTQ